jgi:tellurite resistance protein
MTEEQLTQFIDAVVQASQFSPRATSQVQDAWRKTIEANHGTDRLIEAIMQAERKAA